jgi:hypothetical protein
MAISIREKTPTDAAEPDTHLPTVTQIVRIGRPGPERRSRSMTYVFKMIDSLVGRPKLIAVVAA